MLERMTEWVWAPERETNGWELGGRPDLLPEDEDDEEDGDTGPGYICKRNGAGAAILRSKRQMERASPSSSSSQKRTKKKITFLKKAMSSKKRVLYGHRKAGTGTTFRQGAVKALNSSGPKTLPKARSGQKSQKSCVKLGTRVVKNVKRENRTSGHKPKNCETQGSNDDINRNRRKGT